MAKLTHVAEDGSSRMVDVTEKSPSERRAVAKGLVRMKPETMRLIEQGGIEKGNVFEVARVAGIMAAKRVPDTIPMCHPVQVTGIDIGFEKLDEGTVEIMATVKAFDKTGVEMEALAAVAACGLTIYDMCKAVDREMVLSEIRLEEKSGGKSGTFRR